MMIDFVTVEVLPVPEVDRVNRKLRIEHHEYFRLRHDDS